MTDTTEGSWLFPNREMDNWIRSRAGFPVDPPEPTPDEVDQAKTTVAGWVDGGLVSRDVAEAFSHALAKPKADTDE